MTSAGDWMKIKCDEHGSTIQWGDEGGGRQRVRLKNQRGCTGRQRGTPWWCGLVRGTCGGLMLVGGGRRRVLKQTLIFFFFHFSILSSFFRVNVFFFILFRLSITIIHSSFPSLIAVILIIFSYSFFRVTPLTLVHPLRQAKIILLLIFIPHTHS